jgi:hypothetical protein
MVTTRNLSDLFRIGDRGASEPAQEIVEPCAPDMERNPIKAD